MQDVSETTAYSFVTFVYITLELEEQACELVTHIPINGPPRTLE